MVTQKPKAGRRGEGGGRPRADETKVAKAMRLVDEQHITPEEAAERCGIGGNTLRRALRKRLEAHPEKPVEGDQLALVKRILKARHPAALAELEEGIAEAARGEGFLVRWLARPLAITLEGVDPLEACARALTVLSSHADQLPPGDRRTTAMLGRIGALAQQVERIQNSRPRAVPPDEVNERIAAMGQKAVGRIFEFTRAAWARINQRRDALIDWAREELAPRHADRLEQQLAELLGETGTE